MTEKRKFSRELNTPIPPPNTLIVAHIAYGAGADKEKLIYKTANEWVSKEIEKKLILLAKEFAINTKNRTWKSDLLWRIAVYYIDGLKIDSKSKWGRQSEWQEHIELYADILKIHKYGKSISTACQILTKRKGPWKGRKAGTLETIYYRTAKKIRKQFEKPDGHPVYAQLISIRDA